MSASNNPLSDIHTYIHSVESTHTNKVEDKNMNISSSFRTCCISFIYVSNICVCHFYILCCWARVLSDIFKTLTVKLTSGFRPCPHFLENKIFAENIWQPANLLIFVLTADICHTLVFQHLTPKVRKFTTKQCELS